MMRMCAPDLPPHATAVHLTLRWLTKWGAALITVGILQHVLMHGAISCVQDEQDSDADEAIVHADLVGMKVRPPPSCPLV